jgi:hypothetical protein
MPGEHVVNQALSKRVHHQVLLVIGVQWACYANIADTNGADVHTRTRRVAGCGRVSAVDRAASAREGGSWSLGVIHFAKGMYIYTGRAARGLRARVLRHTRGAVRLHWHIDYLLAQRTARVERVILASTDPDDECRVNRAAAEWSGCGARFRRLGLP